ncbi:ankyrin repeat-containing domain protein [Roridomyces roridus]|uniref:Ankyrin repeat-containing domain protein n=1 Tax=Roridomyces roridus TaxID=1738132 RepID=A0AAD7B7U0_9AGAR|nr:ankyrin repeat-containing domain protein [Roridomyces roridus]
MRQKQHATQKLRKEDTGSWFLEGTAFVEWQDNPGTLWIQGGSGTGKSVLSSSVVQKLLDEQQLFADLGKPFGLGFFYFDFAAKDGNAVEAALRRLILQLSAQSHHPFRTADKHFRSCRGQALPNFRDLQRIVTELFQELGRVYIVLDALDECPDVELVQLVTFVGALRAWTTTPLHLLFTSQPRTIFAESFMDVPSVTLDADVVRRDIELFVRSELRENRQLKVWVRRVDEIVDRVLLLSNGMFRLAACLLLELSRCKRQNELDKTFYNLPKDLFGVYDRFIEAIREEDLVYVTAIFRWLIFSTQNLDLAEMADAIAFDFPASSPCCFTYDPTLQEDNANAIPDWLEGLTTVHTYDDGRITLSLAHASVQDYLLSGRFAARFGHDLAQGPSHAVLASSCIGYLVHFADHEFDLAESPMAEYMARRWIYHILRSRDPRAFSTGAMRLLEDGSSQFILLNDLRQYRIMRFRRPDFHSGRYDVPKKELEFQPGTYKHVPALYMCAEEGYTDGVRWLLQKSSDHGSDAPALHAASSGGHTEIVPLLLANGVDVNAKDENGRTALELACADNHADVVRLLLSHGAEPNTKATFLGTALQTAAWVGNQEIVGLLLDHGARVNAQGKYFGSALQAAVGRGNRDITRMLLDRGADTNLRGGNFGSALAAATVNGHAELVSMLLDYGGTDVNINAQSHLFGSPVQAVRRRDYEEAVRFLSARGADLRAQTEYLGSALQAAVANGHLGIVSTLLERGADVNVKGRGRSAMYTACSSGDLPLVQLLLPLADGGTRAEVLEAACVGTHIDVVRVLLSTGTVVTENTLRIAARQGDLTIMELLLPTADPGHLQSALDAASERGHVDVVCMLLNSGLSLESSLGKLLDAACHSAHTEMVEFLLYAGADPNGGDFDSFHGSPLLAAAYKGNTELFKLLIDRGADVNARLDDSDRWSRRSHVTALQGTAYYGRIDIVRLLLSHGADVNTRGGEYETALQASACFTGPLSREVLALLIANGAQVNVPGGKYGSALARTCKNGDIESVRLLLAQGADVNAQGGKYGNAFSAACQSGNKELVELLLAHGADVNSGPPLETFTHQYHGDQMVEMLVESGFEDTRRRETELQEACRLGDVERVRALLASGCNVDEEGPPAPNRETFTWMLGKGSSNEVGGSALLVASRNGHAEIIRLLLDAGVDVKARGGEALLYAADFGHVEVARLLINSGSNPNLSQRLYGTALQSASRRGHTDVVRVLLAGGADINAPGGTYGGTALQEAADHDHVEITRLLLEQGADINASGESSFKRSALHAACMQDNTGVLQLLLAHGVVINADSDHGTALHVACQRGHIDSVRMLLEHGADIHAIGGVYGTVLQAATISGDSDIVQLLIAQGADVNARGGRYGSALGAACRRAQATIIRILGEHGAEVVDQPVLPPDARRWDLQPPISII